MFFFIHIVRILDILGLLCICVTFFRALKRIKFLNKQQTDENNSGTDFSDSGSEYDPEKDEDRCVFINENSLTRIGKYISFLFNFLGSYASLIQPFRNASLIQQFQTTRITNQIRQI